MKGLDLTWDVVPGTADAVVGDPVRLRQIIFNLVGNAIKFTEKGSVAVRIRPESADERDIACHFEVSDTGIGIPEEKKSAIFAPFQQADTSTTRVYGGTGLGLTISARLAEMMRGRIWLDSKAGQGSTFHFVVRLGLQDTSRAARAASEFAHASGAAAALERPGKRSLDVLLIEDNAVNRKIAQITLEKAGHKVHAVDNGSDGLKAVRRRLFDLVLIDVQMPHMDGIETTRAIRESEKGTGRHVSIVALTAHALTSDRERCLQAGMDGYLTKPIQPASLLEAIDKLHVAASRAAAPPPGESADVIDRAALLLRIDGDAQLLGEVSGLFISESGKLLGGIREAIAARDAEGFGRAVHTMRGMLRSLSANAADELARTLQSLDVRADRAQAETVCVRLERAIDVLKARLHALAAEADSMAPTWPARPAPVADAVVQGAP
jgi:CheY-like chemotaxis protein/HPt (histidine-containing phosphotransfer) domain-containing protein